MERLLRISENRIKQTDTGFHRYLYNHLDWKQPLTIIKGARGTGKTTLLLQKLKEEREGIYLSLDDFYFEDNRLILLIEQLYESGQRHFYLDEIHQYPYWARDIKNLYDHYPDIRIVATGSSVLKIEKEQADLSRRVVVQNLYGLSFREFLNLEYKQNVDTLELKDILERHTEIADEINDLVNPLTAFKQYLKYGYYPFFLTDKKFYLNRMQQVIQIITDFDLPAVDKINYATVSIIKRLLFIISQSVPFTPNIQSLAARLNTTRNTTLKALDLLERAGLINLLKSDTKGMSYLQKPDKIYLDNTNLAYAFLSTEPNTGNLRETFFFNQLKVKHRVTTSRFSDFFVDDQFTFEIGGSGKTEKQIRGIPLAYIAADGIKQGSANKVPLWLFGFLY